MLTDEIITSCGDVGNCRRKDFRPNFGDRLPSLGKDRKLPRDPRLPAEPNFLVCTILKSSVSVISSLSVSISS